MINLFVKPFVVILPNLATLLIENTTTTGLGDLPEPYNKMIKQLSKLALQALNNNQLVFTYDEIKVTCPDVIATPEGINGAGMLQAVQHIGLTGKMMTFNFLHFTIQEYLAVHYIISYLSLDEELQLLQEKFYSDLHINMFRIYVALTKGQRSSFKQFLSCGDKELVIANEFLKKLKECLHLYHCFYDAGDKVMCTSIKQAAVFNAKEINLADNKLSAMDVESLSLFFTTSSCKQWTKLNMKNCRIQDHGMCIIHRSLNDSGVTIAELDLSYNDLTQLSFSLINDIVLKYKVQRLWVTGNKTIGRAEEPYTMLSHPTSVLTHLYMCSLWISSPHFSTLFSAVKHSQTLQELCIDHAIYDDVAKDIADALAVNNSLEYIDLKYNSITFNGIKQILSTLQTNTTLGYIGLPSCLDPYQNLVKIQSIQNDLNKIRKDQGVKQELTINVY